MEQRPTDLKKPKNPGIMRPGDDKGKNAVTQRQNQQQKRNGFFQNPTPNNLIESEISAAKIKL